MNALSPNQLTARSSTTQLARLSGPHGYRFDSDTVHLNAMFALFNPAAHERAWALQLWACPSAHAAAADSAGHNVAEVSLPPMGELTDESEHFEINAAAWTSTGAGDHAMVLVLATGQPGQFDEVHDLAVYPRREDFYHLRMGGAVGYRVDGARSATL